MYKYYVIGNQKLTASTLLLTLKKGSDTKPFMFRPGQYATLNFSRKGRLSPARCFSIANSPTDQGILQFSIRIKGRYTNRMTELAPGDEVQIRGPFGSFVFDEKRDLDVVMIAGGMGIAPLIGIVHYATNLGLSNKINLLYSVKNQDDVPFVEQLKDLTGSNPNFKTMFVISDGPNDKLADLGAKSGRITPEIINQTVGSSYLNKKFFICGPPAFMDAMSKTLHKKGVNSSNIFTEAFSQGPAEQTGKLRSWPNNIYVLGAAGVVLASLAITVKDILNTLPASSFSSSSSLMDSTYSINSRQNELDNLVNGLSGDDGGAPASTTSTTPANTPTPAPAPKCTTTQSGVTTCF